MNLRLRPLLALGALLFTAKTASAQFVELLTEAPVTFQVTITTTAVTTTATERKTTSTVTRLTHAQVLEELRASGVIPDSSITGWRLVAVRAAPADLYYVDGAFFLYAVNGNTRIQVPLSKFRASNYYTPSLIPTPRDYGRAQKYTERSLGAYVLSSKGTVTAHSAYHYQPVLNIGSNVLTVDECLTDGFATISYQSKDLSDGYEVFFFAPTSIRITTRGGFSGSTQVADGSIQPTGLMTLTVAVGAPKLVPAAFYPEVDYFENPVSRY